jgi:hypothetical protein
MGHGIQAELVYHHEHRQQDEVTAGRGFPRATSPTIDSTKRCLSWQLLLSKTKWFLFFLPH